MNTMTSGLISYIDSNISELQSLSRDTILEIAHKEQIQACQYIIDCWHEPLRSLKTATLNIAELVDLLNRAIQTKKGDRSPRSYPTAAK